MPKICKN